MSIVLLLQYMATTIFAGMALMSLFIYVLGVRSPERLIFAATCLLAGTTAVLETQYYFSSSPEEFNVYFRYSNLTSTLAGLGLLWFVVDLTDTRGVRRRFAQGITLLGLFLLVVNHVEPYGVLYASIDKLRSVDLPWGETIHLAVGTPSRWDVLVIVFLLAHLTYLGEGCYRYWRQNHDLRAIALGISISLYAIVFTFYNYLVDSGVLTMVYLNTYAVLGIVVTMYGILAAEVVDASKLSQKILENERRWNHLLNKARLLVIGIGTDDRINLVNQYFEQNTGFHSDDLVGLDCSVLFSAKDRLPIRRRFHDVLSGAAPREIESVIETNDGEQRIVIWTQILLREPDEQVSGLLMIGTDVTELRDKESELETALVDERGRIAGDLHDSVTPNPLQHERDRRSTSRYLGETSGRSTLEAAGTPTFDSWCPGRITDVSGPASADDD